MALLTQLNTLETAGLLRLAAVQPELEYLFRHALMQDAAYASLLKSDRKQLHLATCQAFEQLYPDQTDDLAATLAYHYEKAEDNEHAVYYFRRAGDLARNRYANVEAVAFYQAAARLVSQANEPSEQQRTELAKIYEDTGDLLEVLGKHDAAKAQYDAVFGLLTEPERIWRARIYRKIAKAYTTQEKREAAFQTYAEAEKAIGQEPDENIEEWYQEWLQIQLERNWFLYAMNKVEEIRASIKQTRPLLEKHGSPAQRAMFFTSLVLLSQRLHRYVNSTEDIAHAEIALAAAQESGDLRGIAQAHWILGVALLLRSELAAAEVHLQTCLRIVEQVGDMTIEVRCLTYVVVLHRRKGNIAVTRQLLPRLLKIATEGKMEGYIAAGMANEAWLAWREGQIGAAIEEAKAALEIWERIPLVYPFRWQSLWILIAGTLRQAQIADAIHYTQKLLSPEQMALPDDLNDSLEAGVRAWEAGQADIARGQLESAVKLAQDQGYL
jgi:eukaryotic-like serine/threonine-protein kinase